MSAPTYIVGIGEILCGGALLAVTMALHGCGVLATLRSTESLKRRAGAASAAFTGMGILIVASWMLVLLHLLEIIVWALFYVWTDALDTAHANASMAYYFALMQYTTIGSSYNLKLDWRLLEGMNGIAGLLTFAWSTGVLLSLAQDFQSARLSAIAARHAPRGTGP